MTNFPVRVGTRGQLVRILQRGSVGAECGVFRGHFSRILWRRVRPRFLFLVDIWSAAVPVRWVEKNSAGGWSPVEGEAGQDLARVMAWAAGSAARRRSVSVEWSDSVAWLQKRPAGSLDWVYLDSDHSFAHVSRELAAAAVAVRPGGWILGHDYCRCLPGVALAVGEFCQATGRRVEFLTDEKLLPVWPRQAWMPRQDSYNSWAVRV